MALYSLHRFRASAHVDTLEREYADDLDALDAARDLCTDHTVEVYEAERFVARVNLADELPDVRDGAPGDKAPGRYGEDAMNRVNAAGSETQDRLRQSKLTMAQSWDARRHSADAVRRSTDTLTRINTRGPSPWDPNGRR